MSTALLTLEAFHEQRTQTRAESALRRQVPAIKLELEESMDTLGDLAENLPTIQSQVKTIGDVYESGQEKVCPPLFFFIFIVKNANTANNFLG